MLRMAADFQDRNPVSKFILMKSNDFSLHKQLKWLFKSAVNRGNKIHGRSLYRTAVLFSFDATINVFDPRTHIATVSSIST